MTALLLLAFLPLLASAMHITVTWTTELLQPLNTSSAETQALHHFFGTGQTSSVIATLEKGQTNISLYISDGNKNNFTKDIIMNISSRSLGFKMQDETVQILFQGQVEMGAFSVGALFVDSDEKRYIKRKEVVSNLSYQILYKSNSTIKLTTNESIITLSFSQAPIYEWLLPTIIVQLVCAFTDYLIGFGIVCSIIVLNFMFNAKTPSIVVIYVGLYFTQLWNIISNRHIFDRKQSDLYFTSLYCNFLAFSLAFMSIYGSMCLYYQKKQKKQKEEKKCLPQFKCRSLYFSSIHIIILVLFVVVDLNISIYLYTVVHLISIPCMQKQKRDSKPKPNAILYKIYLISALLVQVHIPYVLQLVMPTEPCPYQFEEIILVSPDLSYITLAMLYLNILLAIDCVSVYVEALTEKIRKCLCKERDDKEKDSLIGGQGQHVELKEQISEMDSAIVEPAGPKEQPRSFEPAAGMAQ